jgi:hypothetical protein
MVAFVKLLVLLCLGGSLRGSNSEVNIKDALPTIDCTSQCSFPATVAVTANLPVSSFSLTSQFTFSIDYMAPSVANTESNIFTIVSNSLGTNLLAMYLEPYSGQTSVYFMGKKVMGYGPGATISSFTTFVVTIDATTLTVSNSVYSLVAANPISPIESISNTLYLSGSGPSAGGSARSISVAGVDISIIHDIGN